MTVNVVFIISYYYADLMIAAFNVCRPDKITETRTVYCSIDCKTCIQC